MKKFTDIHSHVAWDIDDGIPSRDQAQKALMMAAEDGIGTIASTPHMIPGTTDLAVIAARQEELKELGRREGVMIRTGAELFMNRASMEAIASGFVRPYEGTHYQLCEYDVRRDLHDIDFYQDPLYELEMKKLIPVIAHVERYFPEGLDEEIIEEWRDAGYVIQVNRTSLMGMHGKTIQKNAWRLVDQGLADVVATDTHRTDGSRITRLSDVYDEITSRNGEEVAELLLVENPGRILRDKPVLEVPATRRKKRFLFF
ncbi:tyrosine-protein phosphatase [uncultured Faecalibaculum sp.]|uniref:tyrosine-protein phosphatase n=1 Tax=uncultured Faecalibaculum sp. TaxID=1729681 RepID=UPI0025D26E33|nr:CpsB/CapC family capsule biosynthesis tyrosine phosphatase [uncultured Faecalibaculum sp.]